MKYFAIGLGILAVLFCLSIGSVLLFGCYLDETEALLRAVEAPLQNGDFSEVSAQIQTAEAYWQARRGLFASVLGHEDLEGVHAKFQTMQAYATFEERPELYAAYLELLEELARLREMDRPHYYNIL